jgi:hypothetical protein
MDTSQIVNILDSDCSLTKLFSGVFSSDQLPQLCQTPAAIVANLDPHNKPGSHWVAFYIENEVGEYFDSYGLPPLLPIFENFLKINCKRWKHNTKCMQSLSTKVCGHYCIWYLSQRARGFSIAEIQKPFTNNTKMNDVKILGNMIHRYGSLDLYKGDIDNCQCCLAKV